MKRLAKQALLVVAALIVLAFLLGALGCNAPSPPDEPEKVSELPLAPIPPITSTAAATVEPEPVLVAASAPPELIAESPTLLTDEGLQLLIDLEVAGERAYTRLYQAPIWPGGASGVTIGIGYDIGHQSAEIVRLDWAQHAQVERLSAASGITGGAARALVPSLADVITPFPLARSVFVASSVPKYHSITRRAFGGHAFDGLPPFVRDSLVMLVYWRGGSMAGSTRIEMRDIRDRCVPVADSGCIAGAFRMMKRVWKGSAIERGMHARCERMAAHIERKAA